MNEERNLSKTEACLGLTLIAGLLVALVGVYVYRFDEPPQAAPPDSNWVTERPTAPPATPVKQTAYRPEWLEPQSETPAAFNR